MEKHLLSVPIIHVTTPNQTMKRTASSQSNFDVSVSLGNMSNTKGQ